MILIALLTVALLILGIIKIAKLSNIECEKIWVEDVYSYDVYGDEATFKREKNGINTYAFVHLGDKIEPNSYIKVPVSKLKELKWINEAEYLNNVIKPTHLNLYQYNKFVNNEISKDKIISTKKKRVMFFLFLDFGFIFLEDFF